MTAPFAIEFLGTRHDRAGFSCGVPTLGRYFREQMSQDIRRRITNCFVVVDAAGTVAGYCTFAATGLPMTELGAGEAKQLPCHPLLPVGLVGRLAVAERARGQGLGSALIVEAIARAIRAESAIFALIVDAKDEAAQQLYGHHGFRASRRRSIKLRNKCERACV